MTTVIGKVIEMNIEEYKKELEKKNPGMVNPATKNTRILISIDKPEIDHDFYQEITTEVNKWWTGEITTITLPSWVHVKVFNVETGETLDLDDAFAKWRTNEEKNNGKQ